MSAKMTCVSTTNKTSFYTSRLVQLRWIPPTSGDVSYLYAKKIKKNRRYDVPLKLVTICNGDERKCECVPWVETLVNSLKFWRSPHAAPFRSSQASTQLHTSLIQTSWKTSLWFWHLRTSPFWRNLGLKLYYFISVARDNCNLRTCLASI